MLYTITCQIAYITPPFGYNLFLMRSMAPKEITLVDIYRSIWPFVIMMVGCIVLVMIFPQPRPVAAKHALCQVRSTGGNYSLNSRTMTTRE